MARRTLTLTDVVAGRLPVDLTAVRWADGAVECRANIAAPDYAQRRSDAGRMPSDHAVVLTDPAIACAQCADKCG